MNARRIKGEQLARTVQIQKKGMDKWIVPSQTGNGEYTVNRSGEDFRCTCPDYQNRGQACKHIYAVEVKVLKWFDNQGNSGTEVIITKHTTYPQDWANYTKAQTDEGRLFHELLKDLVENVPDEPYTFGRPKIPLKTTLFCAIEKVYSMKSSRRAYSQYQEAEAKQQIGKAPNYNMINKRLNDIEITPILHDLLHITALPLKSVETKFSPDSTGFRTSRFSDYCEQKHNTRKQHRWIKCHAITGNTTNIVISAIITDENVPDSPQFTPLVQDVANMGFRIGDVTADKGYSSIDNYNTVQQLGGTAYIPFKTNTTGTVKSGNRARLWRKMFHYFQLNNDEFMEHYHNRSNVETTFHAIKAKLGDSLKSKNYVSQANETLCKLIAYNITVLISAMYELKIQPSLIP